MNFSLIEELDFSVEEICDRTPAVRISYRFNPKYLNSTATVTSEQCWFEFDALQDWISSVSRGADAELSDLDRSISLNLRQSSLGSCSLFVDIVINEVMKPKLQFKYSKKMDDDDLARLQLSLEVLTDLVGV